MRRAILLMLFFVVAPSFAQSRPPLPPLEAAWLKVEVPSEVMQEMADQRDIEALLKYVRENLKLPVVLVPLLDPRAPQSIFMDTAHFDHDEQVERAVRVEAKKHSDFGNLFGGIFIPPFRKDLQLHSQLSPENMARGALGVTLNTDRAALLHEVGHAQISLRQKIKSRKYGKLEVAVSQVSWAESQIPKLFLTETNELIRANSDSKELKYQHLKGRVLAAFFDYVRLSIETVLGVREEFLLINYFFAHAEGLYLSDSDRASQILGWIARESGMRKSMEQLRQPDSRFEFAYRHFSDARDYKDDEKLVAAYRAMRRSLKTAHDLTKQQRDFYWLTIYVPWARKHPNFFDKMDSDEFIGAENSGTAENRIPSISYDDWFKIPELEQ